MAKKGQKYQKYSDDFKRKVLEEYFEGKESFSSIAEKYNISSRKTVDTWMRKYRKYGNVDSLKKGRSKNQQIDYKERYEILKKYQAFLKEQQEKK